MRLQEAKKKKNELNYKNISITNSKYFDLVTNAIGLNRTLLEQIDTNDENDIPVYTGGKTSVVHIKALTEKTPIEASEHHPVLSFASNGENSGGNFVIHTRPFYINTDRIAVIIKDKISPWFLLSQIANMKQDYGFNWSYKANRKNLKSVIINVPIDGDGNFDMLTQEIVANQFNIATELKNEIRQKYQEIIVQNIDIDLSNYLMHNFLLSDLLEPIKGKSKYTKKYGDAHKGKYPVFSASANSPLTYINTFDFDGSYLSWSTNGFAGMVTVLEGKFSINGDRGVLLPKVESLDLQYLKYVLQPTFRRLAKGRQGDRGSDEFTKLYPSMIGDVQIPLPTNKDGTISLAIQQEVANSYITIEKYKQGVLYKLNTLMEQKISY